MPTLDAPTLLMVNAVFNCFGAAVWLTLAVLFRIAPRAAWLIAIAHLLLVPALLPFEPSTWSNWNSDLFKLLATAWLALGIRHLLRLQQRWVDIAVAAALGLGVLLFQRLSGQSGASLTPTALAVAALASIGCRDVLVGAAPGFRRLVTLLLAAPFGALALVNLLRIAAVLHWLPGSALLLHPRQQSPLLAGLWLVLCLGMSTGLIALVLQRLIARIEQLTRHDALTGALNRRAFSAELETAQAKLARGQRHALLMLDVDHFKRINDQLGHAGGDAALQHLVQVLRNAIRDVDQLGRLGGEEFGLLLPGSSAEEALAVAERLRERVAMNPLHWRERVWPISVSIGVALGRANDPRGEALSGAADRALYAAKASGRNRVQMEASP